MKRRLSLFALLPLATLLACGPHTATVAAEAQTGNFSVNLHDKSVGTASFHLVPTSRGYDSSSLVRVDMKGLNYAFSKNEQLSAASQLQHAQLSATINGQAVAVTASPDPAQMLLNISANGRSSTTRLAAHPAAVFMPDVDPGALQTLLTLAARQNNRDLWAIVPKEAGFVAPVTLATLADEKGTLDGKPITVHHMVATIQGNDTELFCGPNNQLLQAELAQEGLVLVRTGFVLAPPSKPGVPPTPPPANQQQPAQQQPGQQQPAQQPPAQQQQSQW